MFHIVLTVILIFSLFVIKRFKTLLYFRPVINGKIEERLIGDGPNLRIVLRQDNYLVKLRRNIMKFFKKNFEAAVVYIQRFEFVRQFLAENEEKSHDSIENETGTVHIS
jgi:hypothetical protein